MAFGVLLTKCFWRRRFIANGSGSITSVGEERANLSAVVYLELCGFCLERFPLPLGAWDGLCYFIVALPEPPIYLFFKKICCTLFVTSLKFTHAFCLSKNYFHKTGPSQFIIRIKKLRFFKSKEYIQKKGIRWAIPRFRL